MFGGYVKLDETYVGTLLVFNTSTLSPINADSLPTLRVYGPSGFVKEYTTTFKHNGTVSNATNASPIVITSTSHGLTTGALVSVNGVTGNTNANGTYVVTKVNANSFSLDSSAGNGAYAGGGTWNVTGLYNYSIDTLGIDGYESGESYQLQFAYEIVLTAASQLHSFQVN